MSMLDRGLVRTHARRSARAEVGRDANNGPGSIRRRTSPASPGSRQSATWRRWKRRKHRTQGSAVSPTR